MSDNVVSLEKHKSLHRKYLPANDNGEMPVPERLSPPDHLFNATYGPENEPSVIRLQKIFHQPLSDGQEHDETDFYGGDRQLLLRIVTHFSLDDIIDCHASWNNSDRHLSPLYFEGKSQILYDGLLYRLFQEEWPDSFFVTGVNTAKELEHRLIPKSLRHSDLETIDTLHYAMLVSKDRRVCMVYDSVDLLLGEDVDSVGLDNEENEDDEEESVFDDPSKQTPELQLSRMDIYFDRYDRRLLRQYLDIFAYADLNDERMGTILDQAKLMFRAKIQ